MHSSSTSFLVKSIYRVVLLYINIALCWAKNYALIFFFTTFFFSLMRYFNIYHSLSFQGTYYSLFPVHLPICPMLNTISKRSRRQIINSPTNSRIPLSATLPLPSPLRTADTLLDPLFPWSCASSVWLNSRVFFTTFLKKESLGDFPWLSMSLGILHTWFIVCLCNKGLD